MVDRLGVSVWSLGHTRVVTFTEYDEDTTVSYRMTYPIAYCEGCDLASWASRRIKEQGCEFYLSADGWDIYLPINQVVSDSIRWHPIHSNDRTNPKNLVSYQELTKGYHSVVYDPVR